MFCKEDDVVICKACNQSPEHEAHSVVPIKDVAWEYKWKLQEALELLRKEQEEAWKLEVSEKEQAASWKTQTETRKQSILWEFEKYRQLLKEKELPCQQAGEEAAAAQASLKQKRETANKMELRLEKIIQQSQVLWRMIVELEERSQRPVCWMLQEHILEPAAARTNILGAEDRLSCARTKRDLEDICRHQCYHQDLFLVDVRLDPDTAYSRLVVSKDRKSVHYGDTQQNLPDNPERFYRYNVVLGSQCISSGRHYWEVEVGDRSEWGLECVWKM